MGISRQREIVTVFGASGFIGRHLVRRLAKAGWVVRAVCRDPEDAAFLKTMGDVGQIIPWGGNVNDPVSVGVALDGASAAVNLVGILYESGRATFERIHHDAAKTVADACAARGITKLVHMSALGADPESDSKYATSKAAGEAAVLKALPTARIVRPSVVFGPEDNFFNTFAGLSRISPKLPVFGAPLCPFTLKDGRPGINWMGDGGTKFQPVYVGDVADAIYTCLNDESMTGKTYTLAGPTVYSFADLMRLMLKVTGRKRFLVPVPFWMAEILGFFLQWLPKPLLTVDQVKLMKTDNVAADGPGLADLGISPTPAEAVLPTYLKRFRTPAAQGHKISAA